MSNFPLGGKTESCNLKFRSARAPALLELCARFKRRRRRVGSFSIVG
jgi:hypothetical protein